MESVTQKKTKKVSRGYTYTYYVAVAKPGKATVLLLHGFPDRALEWEHLIVNFLIPNQYGVLAPDLLGYAGTSKPTDPKAFRYRGMTADIMDIMNNENISYVIVLGHDWGSIFAQRIYNLQPSRISALGIVSVAYIPPTNHFDLNATLQHTKDVFGYGTLSYWEFFAAPDCAEIISKHLESFFHLLYALASPTVWRKVLCEKDQVRMYLVNDMKSELHPLANAEFRETFMKRFRHDGIASPLKWYEASVNGHQEGQADESNKIVNVPVLFIGYEKDVVCRRELILQSEKAGLLPQLTKIILDKGDHWGLLQYPDEFGRKVLSWLDSLDAEA